MKQMKRIVVWASLVYAEHVSGAQIHITGPGERQVVFGDGTTPFATLSGGEGFINSTVTVNAPDFVTSQGVSVDALGRRLEATDAATIASQQATIDGLQATIGVLSQACMRTPGNSSVADGRHMVFIGQGRCMDSNWNYCQTARWGEAPGVHECQRLCVHIPQCVAITYDDQATTGACNLHSLDRTNMGAIPTGFNPSMFNHSDALHSAASYGCRAIPDRATGDSNANCFSIGTPDLPPSTQYLNLDTGVQEVQMQTIQRYGHRWQELVRYKGTSSCTSKKPAAFEPADLVSGNDACIKPADDDINKLITAANATTFLVECGNDWFFAKNTDRTGANRPFVADASEANGGWPWESCAKLRADYTIPHPSDYSDPVKERPWGGQHGTIDCFYGARIGIHVTHGPNSKGCFYRDGALYMLLTSPNPP